jgi:hypothetical protein
MTCKLTAYPINHSNQPTASSAVAQWAHHYHRIEIDHTRHIPPQTTCQTGCGLGRYYHIHTTYQIVVVRYQYRPRGRWHTGYIGYAPTIENLPV